VIAIAAFILLVGAGIIGLSRTPWPHEPDDHVPAAPSARPGEREGVASA
jgi:hypothetical protein